MSQEARKEAEKRLIKALKQAGIDASRYNDLFPPTRHWAGEERLTRLQEHNIDAILLLTGGTSSSAVIPIATQTFSNGNAYAYGNSASYSGSSTTQTLISTKSRAEFSAVLYSTKQDRVAWYADILTKASGTLFVSEKGNGKGAAIGILRALKKDGHISK